MKIKIIDDDRDTITAEVDGDVVRSWEYSGPDEHREKMIMAREFAEGWYQAEKRRDGLSLRERGFYPLSGMRIEVE